MKAALYFYFLLWSVCTFSQSQIVFDHTNSPITNDTITWVEVDTNNVKWIGTRDGLYSFNNNSWQRYDTTNSNIPSNQIDKFKIANNNTLWFLNNGKGFYKFQNNTFNLYNSQNLIALPTDSLIGLTIDSLDILFWTNWHGIIRFNSVSSAVTVVDTNNSCILSIATLACHTNHKLYGLCTHPVTVLNNPPQNKSDSIKSVYNFAIINTPVISLTNCCFFLGGPCYYEQVITDKFQNRFELYDSTWLDQKVRVFDKSNNLISDMRYYYPPAKQFLLSPYNYCRVEHNNTMDYVFISKSLSAPGQYLTIPGFPNQRVSNCDVDSFHNIWIATYKGLMAYNDSAVITALEDIHTKSETIFPNPTAQFIYLQGCSSSSSKLFNTLGEFINERAVLSGRIDVGDLQEGLYYLEIKKNTGNTIRYKFIKCP